MIRNIFTALLLLAFSINVSAQGYKYKFKVDGVSDTVIYLAKYYGKKQYYEDTAKVDSKGNFVFEGTEMLPGGIYLMVMPDKASYFEFLVSGDEKEFEISNKLGNFLETSEVKGSPENEAFYEYQRFISDKGMTAEKVNNKKKAEEEAENTKEVEKLQAELNAINEEVKSFKKEFMAKYPNKLITKIILASDDPVIPEDLKPIGEESMDQAKLRFYKSEYLKNMDFADDRLLRSPIFHRKLDYYMTKLVVQIPDSIIKEADQLVARTEGNKETFKYVVHYITNSYEKSKIMGMDAIFVHMAEQVLHDRTGTLDGQHQNCEGCRASNCHEAFIDGKHCSKHHSARHERRNRRMDQPSQASFKIYHPIFLGFRMWPLQEGYT